MNGVGEQASAGQALVLCVKVITFLVPVNGYEGDL